MATIPQRLIAAVEAAHKAGAKSGKEVEAHVRKSARDLAENYISHVYMAHKMLKNSKQFAEALAAIRKGASGTLSQIAKPYQNAVVHRGDARPARAQRMAQGAMDADLADALGITPKRAKPEPETPARRRKFIPPTINPKVFEDFAEMVTKKARSK